MAKKSVKKVTVGVSNRSRVKIQEEPVEVPVEEVVEETTTTEIPELEAEEEEPIEEEDEDLGMAPEPHKEPSENLLWTVIFILLIVIGIQAFQIHCNKLPTPDNEEVQVDSKYDGLSKVVKDYVAKMKDPNKAKLAIKLADVYREAAVSKEDIAAIEANIRKDSRAILGFDEPRYSSATDYEYEWQRLFDAAGIINTWLTDSDIVITKENQRDVFMAIAKGLE